MSSKDKKQSLSAKQKQFIDRHRSKRSAEWMAMQLNLPLQQVRNYLEKPKRKKGAQKQKPKSAQLTRRAERLLRMVLILTPVLLIIFLELFLRLIGYGVDKSLFKTFKAFPKYYQINPQLGKRYFPTLEVQPAVAVTDAFLKNKPENGFRIFVLGGSTTAGYPYMYNGSFPSILKVILKEYYPDKTIELVNIAMPAVGSYTVKDIALELAKYNPDLLLIYSGHNEFYGALAVGSAESIGKSPALVNLYLALSGYKITELVADMITAIHGGWSEMSKDAQTRGGTLMENLASDRHIAYGSSLYREAGEIFEANLTDIVKFCRKKNLPVMIGTLTSNVRDQQPFVDIFSTPELESPWKQQYQSAQELFNRKEFREALQAIDQSIAIDSLPASQYFLEGKIFEALGQTRQAYQAYYKAKDYDGLRFRASEDLNRRIERMTEQDGVTTVPVKETFEAHSANGIPGSSLILEHLHPNLDGYKLMAKTFADAIVEKNYLGTATHKNLPDSLWENQIAITEIDREVASLRIRFLKSGWPFTDHAPPAMEEFDTNLNDILNSYAQQFWKNEITWEKMHVQAGQYYVRQKDWQKAELEYRALVQATPMNYAPYEFLSRLLIQQNKIDEAKELLLELIEINPTPHAYKVVGSIYLKRKKVAQAVSYLEKAVRWTPDDYQAQYHLAQGYTLLGRYEEAWRAIQVVLQLNEDYQKARELASFIKTAREKESLPGDQPPGSVLDPGQ